MTKTIFSGICAVFFLLPVFSQNEKPRTLFSPALATRSTLLQDQYLTSAENRHRIVQLQPFSSGNKIDLSQKLTINLFEDIQYDVQLSLKEEGRIEGVEIWRGRVEDHRFNHLPHYINAIFVINRKTNKTVANILTDKGEFQILPTNTEGVYRIRDCKDEPHNCQTEVGRAYDNLGQLVTRADCGNACFNETDASGKYVIDVFAGYSTSAAAVVGDLTAHATACVEMVNTGLSNSLVTTVYLRLVGTGTTPNNPGIVSSVLSDGPSWFATEVETYAADLLAVFQTPTGVAGEQGGIAYMPGWVSVNSIIDAAAVFRHEVGHNVGGNHCYPNNNNYKNGYNNGNWRTHLCGNSVNFYSNPNVNDNNGNPIGNAAEADMALLWGEVAPSMASKGMHRVAYFADDACVNQVCKPQHFGGQNELIKRVVFNTIDNNQGSSAGWTCSSVTGYSDYTHLTTTVTKGSSYTITITPNHSFEYSKVGVWIDWNNNGILSTDERVGNFTGYGAWTTSITVPTTATIGSLRMRVRLQYSPTYNPHSCDGTGYSSGETEDFTIITTAALPITLLNFYGQNTEGGNELTWQTAEEINASHFEIERSYDSKTFEKIGQIDTKGKADKYQYLDKTNKTVLAYYRLKLVDKDGSFEYSKIISIEKNKKSHAFKIFPNPTNDFISLQFDSDTEGVVQFSFTNVIGQKVLTSSQQISLGENLIRIDMSQLSRGVYFLEMISNNTFSTLTKIIKK